MDQQTGQHEGIYMKLEKVVRFLAVHLYAIFTSRQVSNVHTKEADGLLGG